MSQLDERKNPFELLDFDDDDEVVVEEGGDSGFLLSLASEQAAAAGNFPYLGYSAEQQLNEEFKTAAFNRVIVDIDKKVKALKVLIPTAPEFSLLELEPFLRAVRRSTAISDKISFIAATLHDRDYPGFMVKKICRDLNGSDPTRVMNWRKEQRFREHSGPAVYDVPKTPSKPPPRFVASAPEVREAPAYAVRAPKATAWRVPFKFSMETIDRPRGFCTKSLFRRWANSVCTGLSLKLTAKTGFVSGNVAAETLWFMNRFEGRRSDYARLLADAYFYTDDYRIEYAEPPVPSMSTSLFPASLVVHGRCCTTVGEFQTMERWFSRDKAVFRFGLQYLRDCQSGKDVSGQRARLQATIDKKINHASPMVFLQKPEFEMLVPLGPQIEPKYLNAAAPPWFPTSYTYQGNGMSMQHTVSVPQIAELVTSAEQLAGPMLAEKLAGHARVVVQFGAFYGALMRARGIPDIVLALTQFVSGNDVAWAYLVKVIKNLSQRVYQGTEGKEEGYFTRMSLSHFVSSVGGVVWDAIAGAGLFVLVDGVLGDLKGLVVSPLQDLLTSTRVSLMREAGKSFASSILEGISELLLRVRKCWELRSFNPLWGEKWDPQLWVKHVDGIIANYNTITASPSAGASILTKLEALREVNAIPRWYTQPLSLVSFCNVCSDLLDQGVKLHAYFLQDVAVAREITTRLNSLRAFLGPLKIQVASNGIRAQPFYLLMYGPAGAGKTIVQKLLTMGLSRRNAFTTPVEGTHNLALNENFQSGLNHHKWCVVADDIDHSIAPPAAGALGHIELLTKLVNNEPFRVEESESSLKGQSFAAPVLVCQQTNFISSLVHDNTRAPDAWWRRLSMHVTVRARDEFGVDGVLDPEKASASETYDMYLFDVRFVDYKQLKMLASNNKHLPLTAPVTYSFPGFLELFYTKFDSHMLREMKKLARFQETEGMCKVCFMTMNRDCGHLDHPLNVRPVEEQLLLETEPLPLVVEQGRLDRCNDATTWAKAKAVDVYLWSKGITMEGFAERMFSEEFWVKSAAVFGLAGALATVVRMQFGQGREANAVSGEVPFNWFRADQTFTPGVPPAQFATTYTKEDLLNAVKRCWVEVKGPNDSGPAALVSHNMILVPTHYCRGDGVMKVTAMGRVIEVPVNDFTRVRLPNVELSLVKCGELPGTGGLRSFMWQCVDEQISSFDEVVIVGPERVYAATANQIRMCVGGRMLWAEASTIHGDCGSLYVARVGTSWRIVAMHVAGEIRMRFGHDITSALGAVVSVLECDRAARVVATTFQGVYTSPFLLSKTGDATCGKFPPKSEVWAAVSHHDAHVYPFGTLENPMTGSTLKTRLTDQLVAPLVRDLEKEWCGEEGYWRKPNFRGQMVGEEPGKKWVSPFTDAFKTQNKGSLHLPTMWMAVADYVSGLRQVDVHGYAEMSEEQAITGIPGSYVHGVNMRTSVGPPYNTKKPVHIYKDPGNSHMSADMWRMYDDMENSLKEGFIPGFVGLCTLKDEGLKPGKVPRVFTVYASCVNLLLKKKGLYKSLMRANPTVFESAVGINMTGADAQKIVHAFKSLDPSLKNIYEADARRLDKSFSGDLFDFVCLVIFALSWAIGVDPFGNYALIQGLKHTRFCIKNDLFSIFWNGSGNDATVEINGICMSLGERYVYYRGQKLDEEYLKRYMANFFESPCPIGLYVFRLDVILWTYGDDQLFCMLKAINERFEEIWLNEIGIEMTDASKEGRMKKKPLTEAQFLKRRFRFDEEVGRWVTPLDKKTMARMLIIKNESQLTAPDGAALALTECLREAVYHGRGLYDVLRVRFVEHAKTIGISRNGYLQLPEFDHYKTKILEGNFQTWVDRSEVLTYDFLDETQNDRR